MGQDSPDRREAGGGAYCAETRQRLSEAVWGAFGDQGWYAPIGDRAGIGLDK
jgi:hypothetical protein